MEELKSLFFKLFSGGSLVDAGEGEAGATPTTGVSFERICLPTETDDPDVDLLAPSADTDERDGAGRTLWWD
jgi:hypothetical protein